MKKSKLSCIGLLLLLFFALSIGAVSAPAAATSIGEWKFDEGSGLLTTDSSNQGKTGMLFGPPAWVEGVRNKALQFAGSSNYVSVAPSVGGGVNSLKNWSVSIYIKPTGSANESYVYSEKDANGNVYFYISITGDNRIKVGTWHKLRAGGWDVYQTGSGVIKRNEWSHLLVTLQNGDIAAGSGIVKCYVNRDSAGTGGLGACRSGLPSLQNIAGASWKANSGTGLTRLNDAVNTAAGADYNALYPWSEMKTETKDGHSVVKIPKFYYKRTYDSVNKVHSFWVAKNSQSGFKVHPAFLRNGVEKPYVLVGVSRQYVVGDNNYLMGRTIPEWRQSVESLGPNWQLLDIQTYSALQMLNLIEYATTNCTTTSYRGITIKHLTRLSTGGNHIAVGLFVEGINIDDSDRVYIAENSYECDKFDGPYQYTGFTLPSNSGDVGDWTYSSSCDWLFLPSELGNSGGRYSTSTGNRVLLTPDTDYGATSYLMLNTVLGPSSTLWGGVNSLYGGGYTVNYMYIP